MNHKQKLLEIYNCCFLADQYNNDIPEKYQYWIEIIAQNSVKQKGVFTVLVTLLTHKTLFPEQDIRYHQTQMKNGFSGRTIDTKFITPTLKQLELPSMGESGWLTRSLEQPHPYTLDYEGKISNKKVKEAFLNILDFVEHYPNLATHVLTVLLAKVVEVQKQNTVEIVALQNPENLTVDTIISALQAHFNTNYKTHGGSKLPVLAFYAIYQILISELKRYEGCHLETLGSHTASDRTSNTAGDISIIKDNKLFEVLEIKLDKEIDANIVRIAREKIIKFNPIRYYILSLKDIRFDEKNTIAELREHVKLSHGCQIIINGLIPSLKYYLRLIQNIADFVENYSLLVAKDSELQAVHKNKWNELKATF
jgi:DNA (cytosine-5)-methyltransferase 1